MSTKYNLSDLRLVVASELANGASLEEIKNKLKSNTEEEIENAFSELLFTTDEPSVYTEIDEDFFNGY